MTLMSTLKKKSINFNLRLKNNWKVNFIILEENDSLKKVPLKRVLVCFSHLKINSEE